MIMVTKDTTISVLSFIIVLCTAAREIIKLVSK